MRPIVRSGPATGPRLLSFLAALLSLVLMAESMAAQSSAPEQSEPSLGDRPRPTMQAGAPIGEIRIDGRLDEPSWLTVPPATDFLQSEPDEGAPSVLRTEVRILIDDDAIYVGARLFDPEPEHIGRQLVRRDDRGRFFDWFSVSIDANHDRRSAYGFQTNASGVQADRYITDDFVEDMTWDGVWESATEIDSLGWVAEFRVPLNQIRYTATDGPQTWGVNFSRRQVRTPEISHFSLFVRTRQQEEGNVSRFATLKNVIVPSSIRRLEARPYVLSSLHSGPVEDGDPFFDGTAAGARIGSDFRLGLGTAFTLDATVNPDFGQVEADPAEINLTAFETFFEERRPFFVEDAQIFDYRLSGRQNQLFYSRRIGRPPHADAPDGAEFAKIPDAATILAAAKLTGRSSGGLSMGFLGAVTQAESGEALLDGDLGDFPAEPRTEYGAARVRQDLNDGASQVGAIFTAVHRDLPETGAFDSLLDQAYTAGVHFDHQWNERAWRLNGFLAGSHVRGSAEALTRVQTASNHYSQRPDATRAHVDSTATSLTGAEWRLQLDRQNTEHWTGSVWLAEVTNGFEINDLGFSGERERLDGGVRFGYREIRPGKIFRDYSLELRTIVNFSHEALDEALSWTSWRQAYTGGRFNLTARGTFLSFHAANLEVSWLPDLYSRSATRGGPTMIEPGHVGVALGFNSDRRRSISGNLDVDYTRRSRGGGHDFSVGGSLNLRPSTQLLLDLRPSFTVQSEGTQYVTATSTLRYEPTYGRRYFFGELERTTISLQARVSYVFSPNLTFQLFTQPLLSSGDYVRYKQLAEPGTYGFRHFRAGQAVQVGGSTLCEGGDICEGPDGTQHLDLDGDGGTDYSFRDRDFNVRSLIGNAVLRWEYLPGSTIFLVWQRQQQRDASLGDFDFGRDLDAMFGAPADNRFIVKLNYWLGL